jgi:predicted amidophosphoribosyltransferase
MQVIDCEACRNGGHVCPGCGRSVSHFAPSRICERCRYVLSKEVMG